MTTPLDLSALELAALVRSGELSARELVAATLERIESADAELGAFTLVDADGALSAADSIGPGDERPFAGVPIAVKDVGAAVAGLRTSQCSDLFGDYTPSYDSHVVRRLREAGFVIVGKTKAPELAIQPVTEPRRFGPTRNPWDRARSPGGSSGGSAAAVAAGLVPIAHGSDGGGSIRTPAACCGLVGLKPSRGRISPGPEQGASFLATDGVLTRTVADSAAALDSLAGYEPGDATWAPAAEQPFAEAAARADPGRLRVGVTKVPALVEVEPDPLSSGAVDDAAELLASLGHEVEEVEPPWGASDLFDTFTDLWVGLTATGVAAGGLVAGREPRVEDVEPLTWELYQRGRSLEAPRFLLSLMATHVRARATVQAFGPYDVLLTPALARRPPLIGAIDSCAADPWPEFVKGAEFNPYSPVWNVTGQPAISLPLLQGDDGLPLAVQLAGPPLGEGVLLSLAAQLEAARPWRERRPPAQG
jgi:amidase